MKTKAIGHQGAALEEDEKPERAEEASHGRRGPEGEMAMKATVCGPRLSVGREQSLLTLEERGTKVAPSDYRDLRYSDLYDWHDHLCIKSPRFTWGSLAFTLLVIAAG